MASSDYDSRRGRRRRLARILLSLLTVGIIVFFLPRDVKFNYRYDVGKPWMYSQLMATYDFPIYKSDEVVRMEQDSIRAEFQPYYDLSDSVALKSREDLSMALKEDMAALVPSEQYFWHTLDMLDLVYRDGVISSQDMDSLIASGVENIMLTHGRTASSLSVSSLRTELEAYLFMVSADSAQFSPDVMRRLSLENFIHCNVSLNRERTVLAWNAQLDDYSWARGMVQSGEKIIDRGEIVSEQTFDILESLKKESSLRSEDTMEKMAMLLGQVLFVGVCIAMLMAYLRIYREDYLERLNRLLLLLGFVTAYSVLTSEMVSHNFLIVEVLPFSLFPLVVRTLMDSRTAFISFMLTVLICSTCLRYPHEFIILQLTMALVAIYGMRELVQRSQIFLVTALVFLTYVVIFLAYELLTENSLERINQSMFAYLAISSLLTLFTYPLLLVLEKTFGFVTNVTLVELSNSNSPLLRRLADEVPGTFQHSNQVAILAETAARCVGANSQLVRTAALYHDIGKLDDPDFFTENRFSQDEETEGETDLSVRARRVIDHVTRGLEIARKYHLPKDIQDFILTHHGKGKALFFYTMWKNLHPGKEPEAGMFDYPGPDPFTKEQAILMMADAVEASSRSLKDHTAESIEALVENIVDGQVSRGCFHSCPITFLEIERLKQAFKQKLRAFFHIRISYPELRKS